MALFQYPFSKAGSQNNQQQQQQQNNNTSQGGTPQGHQQNSLMNANPQNTNNNSNLNPNNQQQDNNNNNNNNNPAGSDPMLEFSKLWDNPTVDPNDPNQNQNQQNVGYIPKLDPTKLNEFVSGMDFTKDAITPELMTAIQGGGEGATNAMMQVINSATKKAMLTAFSASSKMLEQSLSKAEEGFLSKVPDHVKDMMVRNNLNTSNPIMSDPAYGPLVEVTRQRFQSQYPRATPQQLETAVNKYFDDMHAKMTGAKNKANEQPLNNDAKLRAGAGDADWDQWVDGSNISNIFGQNP